MGIYLVDCQSDSGHVFTSTILTSTIYPKTKPRRKALEESSQKSGRSVGER